MARPLLTAVIMLVPFGMRVLPPFMIAPTAEYEGTATADSVIVPVADFDWFHIPR